MSAVIKQGQAGGRWGEFAMRTLAVGIFALLLAALSVHVAAETGEVSRTSQKAAAEHRYSSHISWEALGEYEEAQLVITGAQGLVLEVVFLPGEPLFFDYHDAEGKPLSDGGYSYELSFNPVVEPGVRHALEEMRLMDESVERERLVELGALPEGPSRISGGFTISEGRAWDADAVEPEFGSDFSGFPFAVGNPGADPEFKFDQVIPDDLIVQGSLCVGIDCVNNESFSFDTVRLKENNTRIGFDDTSTTSGFPANDWEITINDSASGGLNYFAVNDITNGRTPFMIEANAPTNSLRVSPSGRVGLGTAAPVLDLHLRTGNTPGMRLEQDNSSGFTARTWDIAGNEANFFVRDVTGGSLLPFRIRPGAPTSSIDIATNGNVGIGTATATASLDVRRDNGSAMIRVREEGATTAPRTLLDLVNNGAARLNLNNSANGESWFFSQDGLGRFIVSLVGTGGPELLIAQNGRILMGPGSSSVFDLSPTGDLNIAGTLAQSSDRNRKTDVEPVDPRQVLQQAAQLPIATWRFDSDDESIRRMGPMAQDFYAAFGLGAGDVTISPLDASAVALAAIQGLYELVEEQMRENERLQAELERLQGLEPRLAALEAALGGAAAPGQRTTAPGQ